MIRHLLLAAASVAALTACQPAHNDLPDTMTPTIAVLEDRAPSAASEAQRFVVRAVFESSENTWRAVDVSSPDFLPLELDWTVSRNGEQLGVVRTTRPDAWTLARDAGTLDVAADPAPPTQGERTVEFAGWTGEPVYRPLIATATASFATPDPWREAPLAPVARDAAIQAFRAAFPAPQNCASAEENTPRAVSFDDDDIAMSNSLVSQSAWGLVTFNLTGYACDGPLDDSPFAPQMMLVSPDGDARVLGEGLQFLDAGDFDGDGTSEVVFVVNRYNQGGYELQANDFSHKVEALYSYH